VIAIGLALLVFLCVFAFMRKRAEARQQVPVRATDAPLSPWTVLFLDGETETYSLSKLQFYLWTIAALFGYTYLVIGKMLVQGEAWPELPGNLPAIVGLGSGSAVGA